MSSATEQAAGGLVWRNGKQGLEVLVVRRPRYDDWTFPKGKLDPNESLIECAAREVAEETGFECRVGRFLGTTSYVKPEGGEKEISYWAMEAIGGEFQPNDEVDAIRWLPLDQVPDALTYQLDCDFLSSLDPLWMDTPDRILLVRHAHAGDRFRWSGDDDRLRPLSDRGEQESKAIVELLAIFDIERITTSPAARCTATVAPLAEARGTAYDIEEDLWETASHEAIASVVKQASTGTNVLCSHGPVVATTIHLLTGASLGVPMEKGSTWVLDFSGGALVAANYIAAPRV